MNGDIEQSPHRRIVVRGDRGAGLQDKHVYVGVTDSPYIAGLRLNEIEVGRLITLLQNADVFAFSRSVQRAEDAA